MLIKSRLKKAEVQYCETLQDLLTNPKNEDLPNEIIQPQIEEALNKFVQELLLNEDETAAFIAEGNVFDEMKMLPIVFEHFKSAKIYVAIKTNCEIAFSHKFCVESADIEQERKAFLAYMEAQLDIV
jgi:hypothetical protein